MPIDHKTYRSPAIKGDISGIAIDLTIALDAIANALHKIKNGELSAIDDELEVIRKSSKSVMDGFDRLTGWKNDA